MSNDTGERRRQARGRARIEQILRAAAAVFGELGYEATTTNAIAARAGISPGSLYQFFANKDEIGRALAETYAERLATLDVLAGFHSDGLDGALRDALDRITAFNIEHPGFKALFARTDMPTSMRDAVAPVHAAIEERIRTAVAAVLPRADADRVRTTATVILSMVKGLLPVIVAETDDGRRRSLADELHRSVLAYLTAVRGEVGED